ncbi:MAG: hypothetical protein ABEN55_19770, partial [Bradymonadaceae bacterium]
GKATGNLLELLDDETRSSVRTMLFEAFRSDEGAVRRRLELNGDMADLEAARLDDSYVELSFEPAPADGGRPEAETPTEEESRVEQLEQQLEETRA